MSAYDRLRIRIPGYRLLGPIGRGGQATVYKGVDDAGNLVAVKILHAGPFASASDRQRLARETAALQTLDHPNIVRFIAGGESESGHDYLVMNYIAGRTLNEIWEQAACDRSYLLGLFVKICAAVGAAHRCGITHRDVNPANILVDSAGEPHVLDFGLARSAFDQFLPGVKGRVSVTGQFLGKIAYASPEQARGKRADADVRTDVYALGVMLYQILSGGRFPYPVDGDLANSLHHILHTPPARLPAGSPTEEALHAIAWQALSKSPHERHQSAGELGRDVEQWLASPMLRPRPRPWRRRRVSRRVALAGAGLVAIGGPAAVWSMNQWLPREIDLLELAHPVLDRRMGDWRKENGQLHSAGKRDGGGQEIEFPYAPPLEYDWHVSFRGGDGTMYFTCQGGGHRFVWCVGVDRNTVCGLEMIDGKTAVNTNPTTRRALRWIVPGQTNTTLVEVRRDSVRAFLNDQQIVDYPTDFRNLEQTNYQHGRRPDTLAITAMKDPLTIERCLVVERGGRGETTRGRRA